MKMVDLCTSQPFLPDFDKSFPPAGFDYKKVALDSLHAKQMCWEADKGSFGTVVKELSDQLQRYLVSQAAPSTVQELEALEIIR